LMMIFVCIGKRNDDENAKEKLYTYVSHVPVATFKVRLRPWMIFSMY